MCQEFIWVGGNDGSCLGDPTAVLWKGDSSFLRVTRVVDSGHFLGHPEHVRNQFQRVSASHRLLWELAKSSVGLVVALVLRGNPGCLFLEAHSTGTGFGVRHQPCSRSAGVFDKDFGCRSPPESWEVANVPLSLGGLWFRSAPRVSPAAYWSSWADCLQTTVSHQPVVAEQLTIALSNGETGSCFGSAVAARDRLVESGSRRQFGPSRQSTTLHAQSHTSAQSFVPFSRRADDKRAIHVRFWRLLDLNPQRRAGGSSTPGLGGEPGSRRGQHNIVRVCVKASPAEGRRRLHTNTVYAHLWGLSWPSAEHCRPKAGNVQQKAG